MVANINSSDCVVFVASEGAEKFVEAQLAKKVFRGRQLGPEGDLFQFGVQVNLLFWKNARFFF